MHSGVCFHLNCSCTENYTIIRYMRVYKTNVIMSSESHRSLEKTNGDLASTAMPCERCYQGFKSCNFKFIDIECKN